MMIGDDKLTGSGGLAACEVVARESRGWPAKAGRGGGVLQRRCYEDQERGAGREDGGDEVRVMRWWPAVVLVREKEDETGFVEFFFLTIDQREKE